MTAGRHGAAGSAIAQTAAPVAVVGYDGSLPGPVVRRVLESSVLVVGAARHLDGIGVPEHVRRILLGDDNRLAYARLTAHLTDPKAGPAVVVTAGDPGFFGVLRGLRESGFEVIGYPAPGPVAAALGRLGLPWDDAVVVCVTDDRSLERAANTARAHPKVAIMAAPEFPPHRVAAALRGAKRAFIVAQHLGEPDEAIESFSPAEAAARSVWGAADAMLVLDEERLSPESPHDPRWGAGWVSAWAGPSAGWAVPDNAFVARGPQVLPSEVRALILARLAPRLGAMVWEVAAGAGALAVECARLGAAVVAVDRDPDACERIALNAVMHGVDVEVVSGPAPGVLSTLPRPDAIFVGTERADIVRACATTSARTVVTAVTALDRLPAVRQALRIGGRRVDGVQLQASRLAPFPGEAFRMAPAAPVFVLWGELG
ncbi:bifunctional cobalt-precorrin-7 (C(5))-methyltransferase/cobalt-precorrin-6B (C(15))-methyltransferase [Catenulispora yoronensis]|uniref:Bifunctional cobalt-precorrin-7 (C(5))-methyltransferase/cobalt-precorrin-6B (C(15))-methyltransferase n=1 Tax=Catenulispora yoronensis TaxID=450799 RepID=A0ABN2U1N8_9ACTN